MTNLVKRSYTAPQDILGVPLAVHAVGCVMGPGTIAQFLADQVRWVPCSRKMLITTPSLLRALRKEIPDERDTWRTPGGIWVIFEKDTRRALAHLNDDRHFFCVPMRSDPLCEPNTVWVVDVGAHVAWGDGVMWHVEARVPSA